MTDALNPMERQAARQKARAALTWPEKIRMAEAVREWAAQLRGGRRPMAAENPHRGGLGAHAPSDQE